MDAVRRAIHDRFGTTMPVLPPNEVHEFIATCARRNEHARYVPLTTLRLSVQAWHFLENPGLLDMSTLMLLATLMAAGVRHDVMAACVFLLRYHPTTGLTYATESLEVDDLRHAKEDGRVLSFATSAAYMTDVHFLSGDHVDADLIAQNDANVRDLVDYVADSAVSDSLCKARHVWDADAGVLEVVLEVRRGMSVYDTQASKALRRVCPTHYRFCGCPSTWQELAPDTWMSPTGYLDRRPRGVATFVNERPFYDTMDGRWPERSLLIVGNLYQYAYEQMLPGVRVVSHLLFSKNHLRDVDTVYMRWQPGTPALPILAGCNVRVVVLVHASHNAKELIRAFHRHGIPMQIFPYDLQTNSFSAKLTHAYYEPARPPPQPAFRRRFRNLSAELTKQLAWSCVDTSVPEFTEISEPRRWIVAMPQDEQLDECCVCLEVPRHVADLTCTHQVCLGCLKRMRQPATCPLCRRRIDEYVVRYRLGAHQRIENGCVRSRNPLRSRNALFEHIATLLEDAGEHKRLLFVTNTLQIAHELISYCSPKIAWINVAEAAHAVMYYNEGWSGAPLQRLYDTVYLIDPYLYSIDRRSMSKALGTSVHLQPSFMQGFS